VFIINEACKDRGQGDAGHCGCGKVVERTMPEKIPVVRSANQRVVSNSHGRFVDPSHVCPGHMYAVLTVIRLI